MTRLRRIGRTAVRVPPLGFGAAAIGNLYRPVDDGAARAAIAAALARGVSYFDTAPHYGFGLSESRLGSVLPETETGQRAVISTKVGRVLVPVDAREAAKERHGYVGAAPYEPQFDYSYDGVMRSYEQSLKRLGRDRVDIVFAHDLGRVTHGAAHAGHFADFLGGGYRAMHELRDSGAVDAIGLGANEWEVCEEALREGEFDVFLLAGRYTLLEQTALESFFPECARREVSIVIGGPYNSGILVQGTRGAGTLRYDYGPAPADVVERVRRIEHVCEAFDVRMAAAALQFPLHHPVVAAVIPGLASAGEVEEAVRFLDAPVPPEFWADLKERGLMHPEAPVGEAAT